MRNRNAGFTLLEMLVVIAIILTLAGMMVAAAQFAKERAKIESSRAVVQLLASACDEYWAVYHDYPYHRPEVVGLGTNTLATNVVFNTAYFKSNAWIEPSYTITLVYMLSTARSPNAFLDLNHKWFEKIPDNTVGPDGRTLYTCKDGFGNDLKVSYGYASNTAVIGSVDRPWETNTGGGAYGFTTMRITSAGRDGKFTGTDPKTGKDYAADNIEVFLRR